MSFTIDPWAIMAVEFGIKVDGISSEKVMKSASRLNIVSIYSGFDAYLKSYRHMFFVLHQRQWCANEKDTPFDEFRRNICLKYIEKKKKF